MVMWNGAWYFTLFVAHAWGAVVATFTLFAYFDWGAVVATFTILSLFSYFVCLYHTYIPLISLEIFFKNLLLLISYWLD